MASFPIAVLTCVVTLTFVNPGLLAFCVRSSTRSGVTSTTVVPCPPIVTRSKWGASDPKETTAIKQPVPWVFIHHTVTPSCYDKATCIARVKITQDGHMIDRNWPDIAYNFLVGEDGNVYEGRGWDNVGAHVKKYNSESIGIAFIGTFTVNPPNKAAFDAAKQLIRCGVSMKKISHHYKLHLYTGEAMRKEISKWHGYTDLNKPKPKTKPKTKSTPKRKPKLKPKSTTVC